MAICFDEENLFYANKLIDLICRSPKLGMKGLIEVFTAFYKKYKPAPIPDLSKLVAVVLDLAFNLEEVNKKPALELLRALCEREREYVRGSLGRFYELMR